MNGVTKHLTETNPLLIGYLTKPVKNILLIGHSMAGKSQISKLLTGDKDFIILGGESGERYELRTSEYKIGEFKVGDALYCIIYSVGWSEKEDEEKVFKNITDWKKDPNSSNKEIDYLVYVVKQPILEEEEREFEKVMQVFW